MPDWLQIIVLGIVEGVTEFLPISSTGHLLIVERWITRDSYFLRSEFFNVVIQCGAVLAVLGVFSERAHQLLFHSKEPANRDYLLKLMVAFFITGVGGLALKKAGLRLPESIAPVAWATLIGGVLFLLAEEWILDRPLSAEVTWKIAVAVGLSQLVAAAFPGTSRSGVTILVALLMGLNRPAAAEFSFLLGIPTLLAAGGLEIFHSLTRSHISLVQWRMTLLGASVAAVTAFVVVQWLMRFIQKRTFVVFGWYRIILGGVLLMMHYK